MNSKNSNLIIAVIVIAIIAFGLAFFLINRDSTQEVPTETPGNQEERRDTSQLTDLPEDYNTKSVSIDEANISFFVPENVFQDNSEIYQNYLNYDDCLYIGDDNENLKLVVSRIDSSCISFESFTMQSTNELELPTEILAIDRYSTQTDNNETLILEVFEIDEYNVSALFTESSESNIRTQVDSYFDSFEIELPE